MMKYEFRLGDCLLPIPPEKLTLRVGSANKTITLIDDDQINIIRKPQLSEIAFSFILPAVKYPFAAYPDGFREPAYYISVLERLKRNGKPFRFIVSRAKPDGTALFSTNISMTLEDYTLTESASELFDVTASVRLREYRPYSTKTVRVNDGGLRPEETREPTTVRAEVPVTIGCDVIVNGRLHKDSYGSAPGKTLSDYRGRINYINRKGTHPYHVTTPQGGWLGWVTEGSVKTVT